MASNLPIEETPNKSCSLSFEAPKPERPATRHKLQEKNTSNVRLVVCDDKKNALLVLKTNHTHIYHHHHHHHHHYDYYYYCIRMTSIVLLSSSQRKSLDPSGSRGAPRCSCSTRAALGMCRSSLLGGVDLLVWLKAVLTSFFKGRESLKGLFWDYFDSF